MEQKEKIYLNALNKVSGVGAKTLRTLIDAFGTAEEVWHASYGALREKGIMENVVKNITEAERTVDPEKEWQILEKEQIDIISLADENYPPLLKEIPSPPYLLYTRGESQNFSTPTLAIVGSRKFTSYGKQACYSFSRDLAAAGVTIVSGLAFGIDAIAHRAALDAGGKTIAVLGSSIDDGHITPRSNFFLGHEIMKTGLLLSEYAPPTSASEGTFPARNRIKASSLGRPRKKAEV